MTAADDRAFARPFRRGVLGVAILFVFIGGLLAAFGSGADRPAGVAERWLADVGDTTRKGVRDRSREAAEEVGPVELAADLLPDGDTDGRAAFADLEVGQATVREEGGSPTAFVPFRLHQRVDGETRDAVDGTVVLVDDGDGWRVAAVGPPVPGQEVPSEGGDPAERAPVGLFVGAIALAIVLTVTCSALVRLSGSDAPATE
ncbi:MAG: hypothetical protein Q8K58_02225 [Acidimicrobiales bacterium]|nr:hypothetical protein [Acidimicrobiales bacterium]